MGRLTLNILLSFAQFEREVIGERIRDKFAASEGARHVDGRLVPLGYDVRDRKLVVNEAEAARCGGCSSCSPRPARPPRLVRRLRDEGVASKSGPAARQGRRLQAAATTAPTSGRSRTRARSIPANTRPSSRTSSGTGPRRPAGKPAGAREPEPGQTPALLKGLIFGADGRALSPTHCRRRGRLYRYYVAQRVLKGDAAGRRRIVRRVSAAEIEAAVVDQVRALLRQPEVVVGTWLAARAEAPDLTEAEVREALHRLDPLWDELFPAEQARIVRLLVERVEVGPAGADIRLRVAGLTSLSATLARARLTRRERRHERRGRPASRSECR